MATKPMVKALWNFAMDCLEVHFQPSGKSITITREFIMDYKGNTIGFVSAIAKKFKLDLGERYLFVSLLNENKKLQQILTPAKPMAVVKGSMDKLLAPGFKKAVQDVWLPEDATYKELLDKAFRLAPKERVLHLVDLGDGMLMPKKLYDELVEQFKAEAMQEKRRLLKAAIGHENMKKIMHADYSLPLKIKIPHNPFIIEPDGFP